MAAVKCLLVDDLQENLDALSAVLRPLAVEVHTARSGAQALDILLQHDMALAILDVQMPEMDGFELAELMRGNQRTRGIPLIFVTAGNRDPQRQFKGYEYGAVDFLYKPIDPLILRSKAEVFFELHRQQARLAAELVLKDRMLRTLEMFMGVLGHDLRNPMHNIVLNANVIKAICEEPEIEACVDSILGTSARMSRLINDLLDVAAIRSAGGLTVRRRDGDLAGVVERVVAEYRALHCDRPIELACSGDLRGSFDTDRLGQAIGNLLGNACEHGASGPVRVRADGQAGQVLISIANQGDIAAPVLAHIFDPFLSGSARQERNSGLGLYIVDQIVRAHGGRVEVDTGHGHTCFTVHIPR